jgi:hypothetical protein
VRDVTPLRPLFTHLGFPVKDEFVLRAVPLSAESFVFSAPAFWAVARMSVPPIGLEHHSTASGGSPTAVLRR